MQPGDTGDLESAQQVSSSHLVELSAVMASGQDEIGSQMKSFAEQLKPYPLFNQSAPSPCSDRDN